MKKKNICVIAIATICLLSNLGLIAQIVTFEQNPESSASNIQGKVYIWDDVLNAYIPAGPDKHVICRLYYNGGQEIFEEVTVYTNSVSFYSHNFTDRYGNYQYCDLVEVVFQGNSYSEYYDGIVRIDIYYRPIYDPTIPDPE